MPIYEYRCESCGHELDALQKISDAPLVDCPACGQPALKKLISAAGFRLKGSGWYETDFKKGDKKNLHDTGHKDGGTKSDSKNGAKSDPGAKKSTGAKKATETKKAAG